MLEKNPIMHSTMDMYDMTREEQMERAMKILNHIVKNPELVKLHQSKALHTLFNDYMQGQVRWIPGKSVIVPLRNQSIYVSDDYPKSWDGRASREVGCTDIKI